jgi:hypothetical protein
VCTLLQIIFCPFILVWSILGVFRGEGGVGGGGSEVKDIKGAPRIWIHQKNSST